MNEIKSANSLPLFLVRKIIFEKRANDMISTAEVNTLVGDTMKARNVWESLTAILSLRKDAFVPAVHGHLKKAPKPHVRAVQYLLLGSGFGTKELIADGNYGEQTLRSVQNLLNTACYIPEY